MNRFLAQFVSIIEQERQGPREEPPLPKKLSEFMKPALENLADIMKDPKVKKREPKSMWSYSRTPPEGVKGMEALYVAPFAWVEGR